VGRQARGPCRQEDRPSEADAEAAARPERIVVIDAAADRDEVARRIRTAVAARFPEIA
jgi:thymidylate kinase